MIILPGSCRHADETGFYEELISFLGWIKNKCPDGKAIDLRDCLCKYPESIKYVTTTTQTTDKTNYKVYAPTTVETLISQYPFTIKSDSASAYQQSCSLG